MMKNHNWFWLALLSLASISTAIVSCSEADQKITSFDEFYARFHNDSAYQMNHIRFPLEGLPSFADSVLNPGAKFEWTKDEWSLHTQDAMKSAGAEPEFIPFGDNLILENIFIQNKKYATSRKFLRDPQSEEWYLIYYAAPNLVKQ